jgi:hypothetical protein
MTNNNGFWIGWLDLLAPCTISLNHNQSSAEPIFLDCRGLAPFSFSFYEWLLIYDWTTYTVSRRIHRKHGFLCCCDGMFTAPLPSSRSSIPRVCFCGNVFSDPLPSGPRRKHFLKYLFCCLRVFWALPRNGSTCHSGCQRIRVWMYRLNSSGSDMDQ